MENINKILNDRINHLKSDLTTLKMPKLDKRINTEKIQIMEARIAELQWLKDKIS